MPELPEVETIKNAVEKFALGARILSAEVRQPKLREIVPAGFASRVSGTKIVSFGRKGKYMTINLSNGLSIIFHFGMSGKLRTEPVCPAVFDKHDHIIITTDKGLLVYNDVRRFGLVTLCESAELDKYFNKVGLGFDPWDKGLTAEYLENKFKNRKTAVKLALLDQSIICGIGNIYASEILYRAGVSPLRACGSISRDEAEKIISFTREILSESIKAGGSTIHDYRQPDGDTGHFQLRHCVYNKEGLRCPGCTCDISKTGGIQKIIQGGRSTYFCPVKQK